MLVLLAVPPILSGTYAGVEGVDPAARDAATGHGHDAARRCCAKVEVPCALPLIFSGLRSAMLQVIATATIAAYVGLGGLGRFLIDGLAVRDYAQMAAGAVLVAVLALLVDLAARPGAAPGRLARADRRVLHRAARPRGQPCRTLTDLAAGSRRRPEPERDHP